MSYFDNVIKKLVKIRESQKMSKDRNRATYIKEIENAIFVLSQGKAVVLESKDSQLVFFDKLFKGR